MKTRIGWMVSMIALVLAASLPAGATTRTWTGSVDTNWNNDSNWSGGSVPDSGDDVIVTNTTTKPSMAAGTYPASGVFASFSVSNGATITCNGDTNTINESSGGTTNVKHGIGVTILATNATINGTLDANGKGFPASKGPGYQTVNGGSASHGGWGSQDGAYSPGPPYGSLRQPTALGSGGNTERGGGAIRLAVTDTLAVNGTIKANGIAANWGGGSGGSVWLTANSFTGTGAVQAAGIGTSVQNRGPGGGRMAIEYTNSTFSGTILVAGGSQGTAGIVGDGQPGTLWEPGRFPATGPVTINSGYQYYFPDTNTLYQWNLTVSSAWFEVHGGRMVVSNLTLVNGTFRWDRYAVARSGDQRSDMTNFTLAGDVLLTNNSTLTLVAGSNMWGNLLVTTNSTLYCNGETNTINESSGGTTNIKHGVGVTIRCASAVIDGTVSGSGFPNRFGPGYNLSGSYGGRSGNADLTYGRIARPTALGSGGYWGVGGGAFKLRSDGALAVNGIIDMRGNVGNTDASSGGSIWLIADTLTGYGSILANGGNNVTTSIRSGGGGRVALEYGPSSTFTGIVSVACGTGIGSATGTVFQCQSVAPGASDDAGYGGVSLNTSFSTNSFTNGVMITRSITEWKTLSVPAFTWTDTCMDALSNQLNNVATYQLSGLPVSGKFRIWENGTAMFGGVATNSGTTGTLRFSVVLDAAHTITVRAVEAGTIFTLR